MVISVIQILEINGSKFGEFVLSYIQIIIPKVVIIK